jgi:hypothetical protein
MSFLRPSAGLPRRASWCLHSCLGSATDCSASLNPRGRCHPRARDSTSRQWHNNLNAIHKLPCRVTVQGQLSTPSKALSVQKPSANMSSVPSPVAGRERYRLPTNVKPTHYDVAIRTDLEELTFNGFIKIRRVLYLSVPLRSLM